MAVNLGKDFSQDTIELIGFGEPGGYIVFSGVDYLWYRRGLNTLLTEDDVSILYSYIFFFYIQI